MNIHPEDIVVVDSSHNNFKNIHTITSVCKVHVANEQGSLHVRVPVCLHILIHTLAV